MNILGKYNQAKTITFDLAAPDGVDLITNATFAAGDVVLMSDEGAEANTTNLPTDEGSGYSLVLTAAEMSMARGRVYIIDQTETKVWLDKSIGIETYGNASAEHAFDLDTANVTLAAATHTGAVIPTVTTTTTATNLTNLPSIPANWITSAGIAASAMDGKGDWNIGKTGYTVSTVSDKSGYSLSQAFPTNFADLSITVTTGQVELLTATQASIDAIEADTNEIQGDLANDGRLDLIFDAILTDTGTTIPASITALNDFDPTNDTVVNVTNVTAEVDANITKINSVTITGDGSATPFDV